LHRRVALRYRLVTLFRESLLFGFKLFDDARSLGEASALEVALPMANRLE